MTDAAWKAWFIREWDNCDTDDDGHREMKRLAKAAFKAGAASRDSEVAELRARAEVLPGLYEVSARQGVDDPTTHTFVITDATAKAINQLTTELAEQRAANRALVESAPLNECLAALSAAPDDEGANK